MMGNTVSQWRASIGSQKCGQATWVSTWCHTGTGHKLGTSSDNVTVWIHMFLTISILLCTVSKAAIKLAAAKSPNLCGDLKLFLLLLLIRPDYVMTVVLIELLLLCGDVETNPGPTCGQVIQ